MKESHILRLSQSVQSGILDEVLESAFDQSSELIAIMDREFNFIRVNEAYAKADGKETSDFPGVNHFDLYPSEEVKAIFEEVVSSRTARHVLSRPFVYPNHPERGITYWDWLISPVCNKEAEVEYLLFTLRDITRRQLAEMELKSFWDMSTDLFCVIEGGLYNRVNQAFQEALQFESEELIQRPLIDFVHPDDRVPLSQKITFAESISGPVSFENRHRCKDGTYRWLAWIFTPSEDSKRLYAVARDVTEQKAREQEAKRLENLKLVAQMSASIAHEVRNPLTTIRASLQLLSIRSPHKEEKIFNVMISELDRANAILNRFLSLSREKPIHKEMRCLNNVLRELQPLLYAEASQTDIDVSFDLKPIPEFALDREEICQLILNLVRNAIEAMDNGGTITLRTFLDGNQVHLVIVDEGSGIPDELLEKIGDPFFTTKSNGTGLGIAICKKIAEQHKGKLLIASSESGTSVTVQFCLI